jgi:hypothetical protein
MVYYEYMRRILLFFALILSLLFFTCDDEGFGEYEGVNLISEHTLSEWVLDQTTPYMEYADISGTVSPPAAYPGNSVYRLEILNLINNGDFNSGSPAPWDDGGTALTFEVINTGTIIDSNTFHFVTNANNAIISLNLSTASDGYIQGARYLLRYDYRTGSNGIRFEYSNGTFDEETRTWKIYGGAEGANINPYFTINPFPNNYLVGDVPDITVGASAAYSYVFGSYSSGLQQSHEGFIDNVKLIRTDISQRIRIVLNSTTDTVEPLISGWYRFSVYVLNDISAITQNNRFAAGGVTLSIISGAYNEITSSLTTTEYSGTSYFTDGTDGDWSSWTELYVDLFIQFDSGDGVELSICPMNISQDLNIDSGVLIISSPSFVMYPDGL